MFTRKIHLSWKLALLVAGLVLALSPATAVAQVAFGELLEVLENPPPQAAPGGPTMPGTFPPGIGGRLAQATLVGSLAGISLLTGEVELHAQSRVPFDPANGGWGIGTISGVFNIANGSKGVVVGKLDGFLDFTPFNASVPLAPTMGNWSTLGKNRTGGTFAGVALVPFACPLGFGACYLTLDANGNPTFDANGNPILTPLTANEFNKHGVPVAKFLFTLFQ